MENGNLDRDAVAKIQQEKQRWHEASVERVARPSEVYSTWQFPILNPTLETFLNYLCFSSHSHHDRKASLYV